MKLDDFAATLANLIEKPMSHFNELKRVLREQSSHFGEWTDALPEAAQAQILTRTDETMLRARTGPKGGVDADPFRAGFLTIAAVMNSARSEVALQTWHAWHLSQTGSELSGWGDDWRPTIKACPLTKQHLFGEAFKAIISAPDIARRVVRVCIASDSAEIVYDDEQVSKFESYPGRPNKGLRVISILDGYVVQVIAATLTRG